MSNNQMMQPNKCLDLLSEIEQMPEEYIPDLLQLVRLFRQTVISKQTSVNAWNTAIEQINKPDPIIKAQRSQQINQLFESWNQLDEEEEQQETLKIIELAEGVSI